MQDSKEVREIAKTFREAADGSRIMADNSQKTARKDKRGKGKQGRRTSGKICSEND